MLSIRDISYTYHSRKNGDTLALRGVSFDAADGDLTAVIGANGSGKSTLFKVITGLCTPMKGSISRDGQPHGNTRMGVVFQSPALDSSLTVFENLAHHAMLYNRRLTRAELPEPLFDTLDLHDRLDTPVEELSGGFQRRVELAKALITEPDLLVLDEPFTGLDLHSRDGFLAALQQVTTARTLTTLLITHDFNVATQCDRVVLLEEGRVAADARPAELLKEFGRTVVIIRGKELDEIARRVHAASDIRTVSLSADALLLRNTSLQEVLMIIDERDARINDIEARRPTLEDYFTARAVTTAQPLTQELVTI
ncbi:MAG: ABC transporter ATP-binding protein [Bacteroidetes bacterium]|nr:ABC transporter ATP-binding protein [Bacteroidota bacterium]